MNRWVVMGGVLLLVSGCASRQTPTRAAPFVSVDSGASWLQQRAPSEPLSSDAQPSSLHFDTPALDRLIAQAAQQNRSVAEQRARLAQAEQLVALARSSGRLRLDGEVSGRHIGTGVGDGYGHDWTLQATAPLRYEVDLFGRVEGEVDAALNDVAASAQRVKLAGLNVSAAIAETWFRLVEIDQRKRLLVTQIAEVDAVLEAIGEHVNAGLVPETELHQQRQQRAALNGQLRSTDGERRIAALALRTLVAAPVAAEIAVGQSMPQLADIASQARAVDLTGRPDVQASLWQLRAADHRVNVAVAAAMPQLTVGVTPGVGLRYSAPVFGDDDSAPFFSLEAQVALRAPILDGGANEAIDAGRRAEVLAAQAALEQVMLLAAQDVDSAIAEEELARIDIVSLTEQLAIADQTLRSAQASYDEGATDFLSVLTARQSKHAAQRALVGAGLRRVLSRVRLYRALGTSDLSSIDRPHGGHDDA